MSWFPLHLSIFSLDTDFQLDCSFITVLNVVPLPSEPPFWWEIQSFKLIFPYRGKKRFQAFFSCLTMLCLGMDLYEFILVRPLLESSGFYCLQFGEVFSIFFFFFFFWVLFHSLFFLFSFQDSKLECDLCLELHRILRLYLISFQSISHLLFTLSSTVLSWSSLTLFCVLRIMLLSPPIIIMIILVISFFSSKILICFSFGSIY